jgi:hypothetical protein
MSSERKIYKVEFPDKLPTEGIRVKPLGVLLISVIFFWLGFWAGKSF